MNAFIKITLTAMAICSAGITSAADIEAGKAKAAICAACHGVNGISPTDIWPNLAGQKEGYLRNQIKAFRDGTRTDPTMAPMVAPLTDADIDNLAAYYSNMK